LPHECRGRLVWDHDHDASCDHAENRYCPRCVRGRICTAANIQEGKITTVVRLGGWPPAAVVEYWNRRPLLDEKERDHQ
jgi:hypothetical protein